MKAVGISIVVDLFRCLKIASARTCIWFREFAASTSSSKLPVAHLYMQFEPARLMPQSVFERSVRMQTQVRTICMSALATSFAIACEASACAVPGWVHSDFVEPPGEVPLLDIDCSDWLSGENAPSASWCVSGTTHSAVMAVLLR